MVFTASPRTVLNTAWIVVKIFEGEKERGAETRTVNFSDLDIKPCKGCLGCVKKDRCVVSDDMQKIYDALEQADALVLGSPVYMGQMSAQAKIFTDRLFAQITPRFSPQFKEKNSGKKLILVFTQGNPDSGMFREYFDYTKRMFQLLEFDVKGMHVVSGMREKPANEREDLNAAMKDFGSSLISE
ncbi:MAG: flavodoxin family protein [Oscillospiraceae bacterium]|nr:flavodoxin family protein [Oscillospiraceae bacterium]